MKLKRFFKHINTFNIYTEDGPSSTPLKISEFVSLINSQYAIYDYSLGQFCYNLVLKNGAHAKLHHLGGDDWVVTISSDEYRTLIRKYGKISSTKLGKILYKNGNY